jgi:glycosyltransferase involved in cell wall biosynthesis
MRLVHLTTVPQSLFFLRGQPRFLRSNGIETVAISSPGPELARFCEEEAIEGHAVEMRRSIDPLHDLTALSKLVALLRRLRPAIIHAHTPKAGLLGMMAGALCGVPVRVYHIHGLPLLTARGPRRTLLSLSERTSAALAHRVLCVSRSIRDHAVAEGLVAAAKIEVPGNGSINGIDVDGRFKPSPETAAAGRLVRLRFGIPPDSPVIGFVGRLVRDKGLVELHAAWQQLRAGFPAAHLLLVGPEEPQDPVPAAVLGSLRHDVRVHLTGLDWNTPPLFAAMDVLALPTYREGFPVVPLEAAAMELPIVGTDVPGCRDAVVDGVTGTLIPARDPAALEQALAGYLRDRVRAREHGRQGRIRAARDFRPELLWHAMLAIYRDECKRARISV